MMIHPVHERGVSLHLPPSSPNLLQKTRLPTNGGQQFKAMAFLVMDSPIFLSHNHLTMTGILIGQENENVGGRTKNW
jgi:hypothetical protein